MPRAALNEDLVDLCTGCRHADTKCNKCEIFTEPVYQWRKDRCWGAKGPEIVYLGGSINGHATLEDANEWRIRAKDALEQAGYIVLNPLRGRSFQDSNSKDIVERDLADIRKCDILLVEMERADMGYIGTAMEIRYAWERGKTIVLWGEANMRSHWLRYHGTRRYGTLTQALYVLASKKLRTAPG